MKSDQPDQKSNSYWEQEIYQTKKENVCRLVPDQST